MVREIQLTRGYVALVDDDDYETVAAKKWRARRSKKTWYAMRNHDREIMHRLILNPAPDQQVDHIDGNGLNNQRSNLRPATNAQNSANRVHHRRAASGFRGVCIRKSTGRWQSQIEHLGVTKYLGQYATAEAAAAAYDQAARELFGPFARLNFPLEGEQPA